MAAEMTPPAAAPAFLARAGWDSARIEPLAGDASFRRYFRAIEPNRRAVLMDAPPPHEDPRPFISIARHLCGLGFAAPAILAEDLDHGLVLLEDFGDARNTLEPSLDRPIGHRADIARRHVAGFTLLDGGADANQQDFTHQRSDGCHERLHSFRQLLADTLEAFLDQHPGLVNIRVPSELGIDE